MSAQERNFDFLFEAAVEGMDLQRQIDTANSLAQTAMADARVSFVESSPAETAELTEAAVEAFSQLAATDRLRAQLSDKEKAVGEQLAGMHLSVSVLPGEGRKRLGTTYVSLITGEQEFNGFTRSHRNGRFRATLLGQNTLLLYPQRLNGERMDLRNIVVPILRGGGEPNIGVEQRDATWQDRMGKRMQRKYDRRAVYDIERLRVLAA